jgi:hypothetical protein
VKDAVGMTPRISAPLRWISAGSPRQIAASIVATAERNSALCGQASESPAETSLFSSCPYVCPEPVLETFDFQYKMAQKWRFFTGVDKRLRPVTHSSEQIQKQSLSDFHQQWRHVH